LSRFFIALGLAGVLCACTSDKPDASTPWVVVLDESANRSMAVQRAEQLAEQHPEKLEDATTISYLDQTTIRHLVVSPGQADQQRARELAKQVSKSRPLRLRVLDTRALKTVSEEEDFDSGAPEDAELLEQLAALLPEPMESDLDSFILWTAPEQSGRSALKAFGHGCPGKWWAAFNQLGWQASAQAVYRPRQSPDQGVHFFVGKSLKAGDGEAMKRVYNFLLDFVGPTQEEWEQKSKKKSRKRKRRRRRRKKPSKAVAEVDLVLKELPPGKPFVLPWGSTEVVRVERVAFEKKPKIRKETPVRTALIGMLPDKMGVLLVLYDPEQAGMVERMLAPRTLGEQRGLAPTPYVAGFWQVLPEVSLEEDSLSYLAMQRLITRFDRKRRRTKLLKRVGNRPVFLAGYRSAGLARWQISFSDLGDQSDAKKLYDSAYVEPRKENLQRMLKSRRRVRYDVGIAFHEIGDTLGWHLRGAKGGSLQELYFQRKGVIWLLQAVERGKARMDSEGLLARTELLQIWDEAAENP